MKLMIIGEWAERVRDKWIFNKPKMNNTSTMYIVDNKKDADRWFDDKVDPIKDLKAFKKLLQDRTGAQNDIKHKHVINQINCCWICGKYIDPKMIKRNVFIKLFNFLKGLL